MKIPDFKLEEFWKKYEFSAPYLLCPSDVETWSLKELLALADAESRTLWDNLHLGYTESPGLPLLREEIAKLYSTLDKDHILTTAGAEEGIYCSMQSLLSPGDHAIVISPCYQSLETLPKVLGAEVTSISLDPKKKWKLDIEQLNDTFRLSTRLLILNCPHNPTGALLDKKVFETMIKLARANGAYIFSDEVYRYLEIDESKRLPAIADAYEKGISLNVMTKAFGLAGLRIGWLASRDKDFLQEVGSYKLYTSICNSAPSEILALMALRAKDVILKRNREIMMNNLDLLDQFFERYPSSFAWNRPESGTIAFPELLLPIPIDRFTEKLVEEAGILIMPGSVFDFPGNFFRIGFGRKNMPEVLKRFEQYLKSHANIH
jgi:aspartate/methionine/tyrosine aminotransferase